MCVCVCVYGHGVRPRRAPRRFRRALRDRRAASLSSRPSSIPPRPAGRCVPGAALRGAGRRRAAGHGRKKKPFGNTCKQRSKRPKVEPSPAQPARRGRPDHHPPRP
eukprot:scaffold3911_cov390-Prasinococcus_capsulatus_cf.AAC.2